MPQYEGQIFLKPVDQNTNSDIHNYADWIANHEQADPNLKIIPQNRFEAPEDKITKAILDQMGLNYDAILSAASMEEEGLDISFVLLSSLPHSSRIHRT